ncbi:MAG TPA: ferric reductase, partial [Actinomycetes bacterium]|nr:ferric reductase [Actinomycetes bacterium]
LRVVDVRVESPDTVSVVMRGRGLDRLNVRGGQFMHWRFLRRGHFWQAHPYSLSAMPQPPFLRITVKALGDHSADLARLPIGTRVWFEGAYGAMTPEVVRGHRVLLVAGGVGLTPLRALLEDLPSGVHPVVIVRASRAEDVIHRAELEQLVAMRQGVLHVVTGSRRQVRLDRGELYRLVPDVARREVFLCGPDGLVNHLQRVLRSLGVPETSMHSESFGV